MMTKSVVRKLKMEGFYVRMAAVGSLYGLASIPNSDRVIVIENDGAGKCVKILVSRRGQNLAEALITGTEFKTLDGAINNARM